MNKKILIVASNYYKEIINNLITGSTNYLKEKNLDFDITYAPGCFEIPFIINKNIKDYKGFISLGCIIRGETYHFEIIANECGRKIMDISVDSNKPIGFGILACENYEQAIIRSDHLKKNKGREAALACVTLLNNNSNLL
jgi:6,7-dimethyl-8-ribityllumazine synthase